MGLFTRKTSTHFERDEAGNVINVTRNGEDVTDQRGWKSSEQLEREYYKAHPEERHKTLRKMGSMNKTVDNKIVAHNRRQTPIKPFTPRPSSPIHNNYNPFGSMFDTGMKPMKMPKSQSRTKYTVIGGKAYPIAGTGKKKSGKKKRNTGFGGMGGFDSFDNYGFFK